MSAGGGGARARGELDELVSFMASSNSSLASEAMKIFTGLTGTESGLQTIANHRNTCLPVFVVALFKAILQDSSDLSSRTALAALVNISQEQTMAMKLCELRVVERCMEALHGAARGEEDADVRVGERGRLLAMALQNLTTIDEGCRNFSGELAELHIARLAEWLVAPVRRPKKEKPEGYDIEKEMERLRLGIGLETGENDDDDVPDARGPLAHVLTNITKTDAHEGRRALMANGGAALLRLLPLMGRGGGNVEMRRGIAGAMRNCMRAAAMEYAEQNAKEADVGKVVEQKESPAPYALPCIRACANTLAEALTGPLSGSGTEHDDVVRERVAGALLLLTEVEEEDVRAALWQKNVPELLKKGYELEEHPAVCDAMERIAESLMAAGGIERKTNVEDVEVECSVKPFFAL